MAVRGEKRTFGTGGPSRFYSERRGTGEKVRRRRVEGRFALKLEKHEGVRIAFLTQGSAGGWAVDHLRGDGEKGTKNLPNGEFR